MGRSGGDEETLVKCWLTVEAGWWLQSVIKLYTFIYAQVCVLILICIKWEKHVPRGNVKINY